MRAGSVAVVSLEGVGSEVSDSAWIASGRGQRWQTERGCCCRVMAATVPATAADVAQKALRSSMAQLVFVAAL